MILGITKHKCMVMSKNSQVEIIHKKLIKIIIIRFNKMVLDNTLNTSLINYVKTHQIQIKASLMRITEDNKSVACIKESNNKKINLLLRI